MLEWMNGWSSLVNGLLKAHSVLINAKSCYLLFKAMLVPGKTSQFTILKTRIPPAAATLRAYPTLIIEYVLLCYSASCYVQAKKELVTRGVMERQTILVSFQELEIQILMKSALDQSRLPLFPPEPINRLHFLCIHTFPGKRNNQMIKHKTNNQKQNKSKQKRKRDWLHFSLTSLSRAKHVKHDISFQKKYLKHIENQTNIQLCSSQVDKGKSDI